MILFILLCLLNAVDVLTTYYLLNNGGKELNKLISLFIDKIGLLPGLVIPKVLVMAVLYQYIKTEYWFYVATALICLYMAVVVNNLLHIYWTYKDDARSSIN